MLLSDKGPCELKGQAVRALYCFAFPETGHRSLSLSPPQHLHKMDILAWRRQNSPEWLPLIMRGIKKKNGKNPHLSVVLYY